MLLLNTAYGRFYNGFETAIEDDKIVFSFDGTQANDTSVEGSEQYKDDMDAQLLATALWRYWKAADAFMRVHAS